MMLVWEIPLAWLWAIACLAGLTVRRSRVVACILVAVASVILLLNTDNNDMVLYRGWYAEILYQPFSRDWLFDVIEYYASSNGVPFEVFRTVLNALALLLYIISIRRMSGGLMRPFPFACFLLMSLWLGTTLFRTFLAGSIACLAISIAFSENAPRYSTGWFIVLTVIAGSIHFVCYFYLILLPAKYLSIRTCRQLFAVLTVGIALSLLSGLASRVLSLLIGGYRVDYYFSLNLGLGGVTLIAYTLSQACLLRYVGCKIDENEGSDYGKVVTNMGLCLLPVCAIALCNVSESFRVVWIILPLLAAVVDKKLRENVSLMDSKVKDIGLMALWILSAFVLAVTVHSFDLSFVPVMMNNTFNEVLL